MHSLLLKRAAPRIEEGMGCAGSKAVEEPVQGASEQPPCGLHALQHTCTLAGKPPAAASQGASMRQMSGRSMSFSATETNETSVKMPFSKEKIGLNSNHGVRPVRA